VDYFRARLTCAFSVLVAETHVRKSIDAHAPDLAAHGANETSEAAATTLVLGILTHIPHVETHVHILVPNIAAVEVVPVLPHGGVPRLASVTFGTDARGPRATAADANMSAVGTLGLAQHCSRCEL